MMHDVSCQLCGTDKDVIVDYKSGRIECRKCRGMAESKEGAELMTTQDKDQRIAVAMFIAVVIVAGVLI